MNENKKNQIKHNLELAKKQLAELKSKNPDGNYEDLEFMIEKMDDMLNMNKPQSSVGLLFKLLLFFVLAYVFCTIAVAVVFGFSHSLLSPIPSMQFITILPLTSLVLFIALRVLNYISNKAIKQPLFSMLFFGIILIIGLAFLDNMCIHLCSSLDKSLLMATVLLIVTIVVDLLVTQKIYLKM
ncbi:MAG: hypothetical protein K2K48_04890 [Anaeroplasmataceae bacterium]|nr:hypothetical protein [Anaeroplasmataceae bacterium]MDE6414729.1 hypothetical protein [Anaeroplasmataceae bacterium]